MSPTVTSEPPHYSNETCNVIFQEILRQIQILLTLLLDLILVSSAPTRHVPQKYHTSILSGHVWVAELIAGHPDCIRCKLGLRKEDFLMLVAEFHDLNHQDSHRVTLEEQITIFLYICVTCLTVRHVGERFQCSRDTISRQVPTTSSYELIIVIRLTTL